MSNRIVVELDAETGKLIAGTAKVKANIASIGKEAKATRGIIGDLGKRVAAFAAASVSVGTITSLLSKAADQYDRIAKLSTQTGLSTDFLQDLGQTASLAGSDLEAAAKAARLLGKNLFFGEASSSALKSLEGLGLSVEKLKQLSPEELFREVGTAIANIEDPTQRAATAMTVFGKSGAEIIPTLEAMKDGLESNGKLTRQQIKDIEELNDAWERLGQQVTAGAGRALGNARAAFTPGDRQKRIDDRIQGIIDEANAASAKDQQDVDNEKLARLVENASSGSRRGTGKAESAEERAKYRAAQAEKEKKSAEERAKIEQQAADVREEAAFSALDDAAKLKHLHQELLEIDQKRAALSDDSIEAAKLNLERAKKEAQISALNSASDPSRRSLKTQREVDPTKTPEERAYDDFMAASMRDGQIADPGTARNLAKAAQQSRARAEQRNSRSIGRAPRPNPTAGAENLREDYFNNRVRDRVGNMNGARDLADRLFGRKEAPNPGQKDFNGPTLPEDWKNALPDGGVAPDKGDAGKDTQSEILSTLKDLKATIEQRLPSETT